MKLLNWAVDWLKSEEKKTGVIHCEVASISNYLPLNWYVENIIM